MGFFGQVASYILLFGLVFGMSATVEMKSLKKQVQNRKAVGVGILMQFFILPFVGFVVVKVLQLPSTTGIILLVITSSPGGSYSNWWCSLFNAELALSVTMTTISTLLSVVMLPTNLVLYTRWSYSADVVQTLDWTGLVISLVVVISGIGGGLFSSYSAEKNGNKARFHKSANIMGNIAGILLVTLSVSVSSSGGGDSDNSGLWAQEPIFYIGVAMPAIIGLLVAVTLATKFDLEPPERVAVAVEACYQNTGIATSVALALYSGDELATAIGVPLFYGIVEAVLLGFFCLVCWKRGWTKAPPSDNICKVIFTSYEGSDDEDVQASSPASSGQHNDKDEINVEAGNASGGTSLEQVSDDELAATEMIQQGGKNVIVKESASTGATMVIAASGAEEDEEELPKVSTWERTMATMRARTAGYGFGIQDEDRGLRIASGPVTLGLSHVPSPENNKKMSRRHRQQHQQQQSEQQQQSTTVEETGENLVVEGRTID